MAIQVIPAGGATSKTVLKPGHAVIAVQATTAAGSRLRELSSAYPVKLLSPRCSHDRRAVLAFLLSYGGGLVPSDAVTLRVHVDRGGRLGLLTQGSTKLYKSPDPALGSVQTLTATVEDGAALLMLPDPLQPFRHSVYAQRQVFHVHRDASLLVLDWISEGRRAAAGEIWDMTSLTSMNEVWRFDDDATSEKPKPRLLVRDNVRLHAAAHPDTVRQRVGGMGIIGTLLLAGPVFEDLCHFFLGEFAALPRLGEINWADDGQQQPPTPGSDIVWSAAAARGCTIVKFGAHDVDGARRWLRGMLERDGTVAREFGSRFLMCLQDR